MWVEEKSQNTYENALFGREVLQQKEVRRIILLTHALHMRRASGCFRAQGFEVISYPIPEFSPGRWSSDFAQLIPRAEAMVMTSEATEEWVSILWYSIRYRT